MPEILDLDLYFQIWISSIKYDLKGYSINILYQAYQKNLSSDEFYDKYIYLPF